VHGRRQILANLEIQPALTHRPRGASEVVRRLKPRRSSNNREFGAFSSVRSGSP